MILESALLYGGPTRPSLLHVRREAHAMTGGHDDPCLSAHARGCPTARAECLRSRDCIWRAGKVLAMALSALLLLILAYRAVVAGRAVARSPEATEVTRAPIGRPEVATRSRPLSVDARGPRDQKSAGAMSRKRQSGRDARRPAAGSSATHPASDPDRWNERMTQVLREAAEVRDELERARSTEDTRLARQESEVCRALIATLRSSGSQPDGSRDRPPRPSVPIAPRPR